MTDESLGVLILGTLIGSPLLVGVGCGLSAAEINAAVTSGDTVAGSKVVAATAAVGGAEVAAVMGALGAGSLLLCSGFISGIALGTGAMAYGAHQAYTSDKNYIETASDILMPTNYLYKPNAEADSKQISEIWKTFKGYVKTALAFITLPALLLGTIIGLIAKFFANTFPKETAKLQASFQEQTAHLQENFQQETTKPQENFQDTALYSPA